MKLGQDGVQRGKAENLAARAEQSGDRKKISDLSKDFEAVFLEIVLKSMRNSIDKSGLVDGGNAEDIYSSMLDGEYAKTMAQTGSGGLSEAIEQQLLELHGIRKEAQGLSNQINGQKVYSGQGLQSVGKQGTMGKESGLATVLTKG
jgi:flagellar protein FlgJ